MLAPSIAATYWVLRHAMFRVPARSVTLAGIAARVLWFDAQVTKALDAGIKQVAVIGAGYDSRAWRFRRESVQFFELDKGATQQDKVRRAPGPGPTYVEADLTTQGAAEALREHGLDASRPALFVVEGVTMYLDEEVVRRQLGELGRSSAVGSRLAADFYPPRDAGRPRDHRQLRLQRLVRAGSGEAFRLCVNRPQGRRARRGIGLGRERGDEPPRSGTRSGPTCVRPPRRCCQRAQDAGGRRAPLNE
jgi:methyltransferase (TIGR00027 family)